MASPKADAMEFSSAVDFISAMLSLCGPMSLPQIFHHIKLSPFSSDIGCSVDIFRLFLLNHSQYFRVKHDLQNFYRYEDKVSNQIVCLKPTSLVPVTKGNNPESERNKIVVPTAVYNLPIEKNLKQIPLGKECKYVVTSYGDISVQVSDSFINKNCGERSLQNHVSSHARVLKLCKSTPNLSEVAVTRGSSTAVTNRAKFDGGQILEEILLKTGPLPVHRLVGRLPKMQQSVREAVGKNRQKLLEFLVADDRFSVERDNHVVSLNTNIAVTNRAKFEGGQIIEKILLKKGSLPVHRLVGHLAKMQQSVREAVGKNRQKLLKFLIADDRFSVERDNSVVSLNNTQVMFKLATGKYLGVKDKDSVKKNKIKKFILEENDKMAKRKIANQITSPQKEITKIMAVSHADSESFPLAVHFVSAMLDLCSPMSLPELHHHIKRSLFSAEIGSSFDEVEFFLLSYPLHFRVELDVRTIHRFDNMVSSKMIFGLLKPEFHKPHAQVAIPGCTRTNILSDPDISPTKINVNKAMREDCNNMVFASKHHVNKSGKSEISSKLPGTIESKLEIINPDVQEGVKVLRKALLKKGSMPVYRLVGYLSEMKQSVRESVGRNVSKLLQFLKANDQFIVDGTEHVVHLKKSLEHLAHEKASTTVNYIAVQRNDGIATTKSKASVTKQNVSPIKSTVADSNPSCEKILQHVNKDSLREKLISKKSATRARRKVTKIVTKAILKKGPVSLYKLEASLSEMTKRFREVFRNHFPQYLNFLLNHMRFVVKDVKGIKEANSIKLNSTISLNPEWWRSEWWQNPQNRQICHKDNNTKQKSSCNASNTFTDDLISTPVLATKVGSISNKLVKDFVLKIFKLFNVKSMLFKELASIFLNSSIPECQPFGENECMLQTLFHEQDFVIEGRIQAVRLNNKSERARTCSSNGVKVSNKSGGELCDTLRLTSTLKTKDHKLCIFLEELARYVTNIINTQGPISMENLKEVFLSNLKMCNPAHYGVTVTDFLAHHSKLLVKIDDIVHLKKYISSSIKSVVPLGFEKQISTPSGINCCSVPLLEIERQQTVNQSASSPNIIQTKINIPLWKSLHPCFGLKVHRNVNEFKQVNPSVLSSDNATKVNNSSMHHPCFDEIKQDCTTSSLIHQERSRNIIPNPRIKRTITDEQRRINFLRRREALLPPKDGRYRSFYSFLGLVGDIPEDNQNVKDVNSGTTLNASKWYIPSPTDIIVNECPEVSSTNSAEITVLPAQSSSCQAIMSETCVNSNISHNNEQYVYDKIFQNNTQSN